MKKYIAPCMKIADMTSEESIMVHSNYAADVKEFKDDDLWSEEVTSEGQQKADLWDKEW